MVKTYVLLSGVLIPSFLRIHGTKLKTASQVHRIGDTLRHPLPCHLLLPVNTEKVVPEEALELAGRSGRELVLCPDLVPPS